MGGWVVFPYCTQKAILGGQVRYCGEKGSDSIATVLPLYSIHAPKRNEFKVQRVGEQQTLRTARMRASYAYKYATKEKVPKGVRRFGNSSIKPKESNISL